MPGSSLRLGFCMAARVIPAAVVPEGGLPRAALARPAPGERTISNAEVPLPRSPLSLAAGTAYREQLPVSFAANRGYSPGDARGEAPCIRKLKISPFPPGRGLGGWGQ